MLRKMEIEMHAPILQGEIVGLNSLATAPILEMIQKETSIKTPLPLVRANS